MSRGHGYVFTEEQKKYIIDNWEKESAHSMKNKFGCTWYAVVNFAKKQGLELPKSNEWTNEQIETLKELSEKYHYKEIAKIMNKSENAIYLKATRMGIKLIQYRRKWTKDEEIYLSDNWGVESIELIAKKLKRTVFSIKVKATRMKLGAMIDNNLEIITISDISEMLDVSRDRIVNTWANLGLKLKQKKLTNKKSYYYVTLKDLIKFLEYNQNEWDSRNLDRHILGKEPDWLKEKRKRDKDENPLWYRRWTKEEIDKAEDLYKRGKSYEEIGDIINRSTPMVANVLRNLGYSYTMPIFWTGKELKFLKDNYDKLTYEEISNILGRTTKAVSAKAEELGYQKRKIKKEEE